MSEQLFLEREHEPSERSLWRPIARGLYWLLLISAVPLAMYLAFGDRHGPVQRDEHTMALQPTAANVQPTRGANQQARSDIGKRATATSEN